MVEAVEVADDLPIVLIAHTESTRESQNKLIDALKFKQADSVDTETLVWEIVTKYYKAKVKLELFEVASEPPKLQISAPGEADVVDENDEWGKLFERNI